MDKQSRIGVGTFNVSDRAKELVNQVLETGRISYGPLSRQFEKEFAALHNSKYAVLSNSGTSSLQVSLQAMKELHGWDDGDEVIIPATTFVATANIILHNRMKPVLIDVEPQSYGINPAMVERAVYGKTKAIIPVHLFGQAAQMKELKRVLHGTDVKIIEDSCECMFASHYGDSVGSLGDIACFSTYVAHLVTTGVGGISTTDNPDYAAKIRSLVNHGRDGIYLSIDDDSSGAEEVIKRRFNFESVGHSFRITEIEAALGLAQIEDGVWQDMIATRQRNAAKLTSELKDLNDVLYLPKIGKGNTHSWMMYPIVVYNDEKWGLVNHLEQQGIETRELLPLLNQPVYQVHKLTKRQQYPVSQWLIRGGFYVGCHQGLDENDMMRISEVIHDYYR